jgi:hypothetical protein
MTTPEDQSSNEPGNDDEGASEPVIAELSLAKAFAVAVGGSIIFGIVVALFIPLLVVGVLGMSETAGEITGWVIYFPFYLLLMAAVWTNAYNTSKPILGHLARAFAALTTLLCGAIMIGVIVDAMA